MQFSAQIASLALAASAALAAPALSPAVEPRAASSSCDSFYQWDESPFTIYHNNWGAGEATSGSQCTTFTSASSSDVVWSTKWSWTGGSSNVKSYSNVGLMNINKQLSAVSSIPSTWKWSYTGSDLVADVSYDLWLAPTSGGTNSYEIMVWLAAMGGAGPISANGSAVGTMTIAGTSWSLYSGTNGATKVYSFVASSEVTSFDGDLNDFFKYLVENEGVSDSLYVTQVQAGTEPFTGTNAVFTTTAYTVSVA